MKFEECLKKHFPLGYQTLEVLSQILDQTVEEYTLSSLRNYNGSYDLEDTMLGALIIHSKLGNIKGFDSNLLLKNLNWSSAFENDVKHNLMSNDLSDYREMLYLQKEDEIGEYDYDEHGRVSIDGGYNKGGYNRDGYDEEGFDEYGYQEDDELD